MSPARFWAALLQVLLGAARALGGSLAPKLGDGSSADWWFAFKFNAKAHLGCAGQRTCPFGGEVQSYSSWSQKYIVASSADGRTQKARYHEDCLGTGADPVAQTFAQVFNSSGTVNYVVYNDQFHRDPQPEVEPRCADTCEAPWGHSKGVLAWDESGLGFLMQVSTPEFPGNGDRTKSRQRGNTLGCMEDDNVEVSQHFAAIRLTRDDVGKVLRALAVASVATDPSNSQLVGLPGGPAELARLAKGLGKIDSSSLEALDLTLSSGIRLIAKPHKLQVPPWQLVSSLLGVPLRVASWWTRPALPSTRDGHTPGCWADGLSPPREVQIATSGQWDGIKFSLAGGVGTDRNHAKVAHSLTDRPLAVLGDLNQQGTLDPEGGKCGSAQNARGGLFMIIEDEILHGDLQQLLAGDNAPYGPAELGGSVDDPAGDGVVDLV